MTREPRALTQLLQAWTSGDEGAVERLIPEVYGELRVLARAYLRRERPGHTLQTSDLVNEAYIRLVGQKRTRWQNRSHFFGVTAQIMRRILVDRARARRSAKRGGDAPLLEPLDDRFVAAPETLAGRRRAERGAQRSRTGGCTSESHRDPALLCRADPRGDCRGARGVGAHRRTRVACGQALATPARCALNGPGSR